MANPFFLGTPGQGITAIVGAGVEVSGTIHEVSDDAVVTKQPLGQGHWKYIKVRLAAIICYSVWDKKDD